MEPTLEHDLSSPRRWKVIASLALAGTLLIGGIPVLANRSGTAHSTSRLVTHERGPLSVAPTTLPPLEHVEQFPVAPPQSSNQTSSATKGIEQPMYQSRANVSITSTVTAGTGEARIAGTATPATRVTVNGMPIAVHSDGTWSVKLNVGHGPMTVNVVAVSADGTSRSSSSVTVG
jgi:hypothetical protein